MGHEGGHGGESCLSPSLRPDIILWSEEEKVLIKLIVLWKDRCKEAIERKSAMYQDPVNQGGRLGCSLWRVVPSAISVKNAHSPGNPRKGEEDCSMRAGGGSKKELEGGIEVEARKIWAVTGHHCWPVGWRGFVVKGQNARWFPSG